MRSNRKSKPARILRVLFGYGSGFFAWLAGFHCVETDSQENIKLSSVKFRAHLGRVFLWALVLEFVLHSPKIFLWWARNISNWEIIITLLAILVLFLYINVFWPKIVLQMVPGLKMFFCPQCYHRRFFKFLPVSFRFCFFVTYLCSYCSCLVDGFGRQIFYPLNIPPRRLMAQIFKTIPFVIAVLAAGIVGFEIIWKKFALL